MHSVFILFPIFIGLLLLDGNAVLASRASRRRSRRERRERQALYELNHRNACNHAMSKFSDGPDTCSVSPIKNYGDLYLKSDLLRLWNFKQTECIPRSDIMLPPVKLSGWGLFYHLVILCLVLELFFTEDSSLKYLLMVVTA
jgi:hypothetical protein